MTIDQIAVVSQIVGSVGVIGSLVFVGLQMRQNTKSTHAQVREFITSGYMSAIQNVINHAGEFAHGLSATPEGFAAMSEEKRQATFAVYFSLFKHFESMHAHYEHGLIDRESWSAWSNHILMYFHQPGVQVWWGIRREIFRPSFRSFMESSPPRKVLTLATTPQACSESHGT